MEKEICLICGCNLESQDDTIYQLKCNHSFHYECLVLHFNISGNESNFVNGNKCPLCRQLVDFLPPKGKYVDNPVQFAHYIIPKEENINNKYNPLIDIFKTLHKKSNKHQNKKTNKNQNKTICLGKTKMGKNCNCKTSNKNSYCNKHQSQYKSEFPMCQAITKSGKPCKNHASFGINKIMCGTHKNFLFN